MKILQLNIWSGRLAKVLVEMLQEQDADVVCIQEAVRLPEDRAVFFTTIDVIAERAGYKHVYFAPQMQLRMMRRMSDLGLAILSKEPLEDTHDFFTYGEYLQDADFLEDGYNNRNVQHATVTHNGVPLHILNHHGYHVPDHKEGNEITIEQSQKISEYINSLDGEVVFCGDLNLAPESPSIKIYEDIGLVNHIVEAGYTDSRNRLTAKSGICDYIFTSPDLPVKNFKVLDDVVSDHQALVIEM